MLGGVVFVGNSDLLTAVEHEDAERHHEQRDENLDQRQCRAPCSGTNGKASSPALTPFMASWKGSSGFV